MKKEDMQKFLNAGSKVSESDKEKLASGNYKAITKTVFSKDG